jgi:hypothetical protein
MPFVFYDTETILQTASMTRKRTTRSLICYRSSATGPARSCRQSLESALQELPGPILRARLVR